LAEPILAGDENASADESIASDSLRSLIDAIPAGCYERPVWRGLLAVARLSTVYLVALALLVATDHAGWLLAGWLLAGYSLAGLFVLAHDAAHQALFDSRRLNDRVGKLLFLLHLHVYEGWVFGHNYLHHGHAVRQQLDFVWHPVTPEEYRALPAWRRLRHRLEWSALGPGFYYIREVWWNKMVAFRSPQRFKHAIRRDKRQVIAFFAVVCIGLFAAGTAVYGTWTGGLWLFAKLFAIPWFVFMSLIGFTVYVHHIDENIKWWPRRKWTRMRGQVEGTTILHASRWLNFFACNIYVHAPHHIDMRIPFYHLPEAARAIQAKLGGSIDERPLRMRDYLRNVRRCKLYDFEAQRWLTYAQARQLASPA